MWSDKRYTGENTTVCVLRSEVKERVVWVDTNKTQVKNKAGKLKEKEISVLEVNLVSVCLKLHAQKSLGAVLLL